MKTIRRRFFSVMLRRYKFDTMISSLYFSNSTILFHAKTQRKAKPQRVFPLHLCFSLRETDSLNKSRLKTIQRYIKSSCTSVYLYYDHILSKK
jgi:hypothetical protein